MNIALYGRTNTENVSDHLIDLLDALQKNNATVFVHDAFLSFIKSTPCVKF